jgi:hypothetical protein
MGNTIGRVADGIMRLRPAEPSVLRTLVPAERGLAQHIREGRFQRALALVTALASVLSGGEVAYEHYRGSYGQQVMYTPIVMSAALTIVGLGAVVSRRVARLVLPVVSVLVILDGFVGFVFHVRGIARRPGGWRLPLVNLTMGPPVFAPLLFGLTGYLGLITSFLRPENSPSFPELAPEDFKPRGLGALVPRRIGREGEMLAHHIREGQFQRNIAFVAGFSAILSGLEASYSHYENRFQYPAPQMSPLIIAPALGVAGIASVWSRTVARTALPALSIIALLDGMVGSFYHLRGVLRMPGGLRMPIYNVIYGPPIFAPMLFAASGFMGVLASLLRRPKQ